MWYIHKHQVSLEYGGPEEGGWNYDSGRPVDTWEVPCYTSEKEAYEVCRDLNRIEGERREREEDYGYSSVLAHRSQHFSYSVHDTPEMKEYPEERPHYE